MRTGSTSAPGTSLRWLLGFVLAWVVLAALGRLLLVGEAALVWPALGLSIAWFLVRRAGPASIDTLLLALAAFATLVASGAPAGVAALGALTNGVQAPVAAALVRRWLPGLDPTDGARALDSPQSVARFGAAVLLPAGAAAVVGAAGLAVLGLPTSVQLGLLLLGRNLCGGLVLTVLTLVVLSPALQRRRPRTPERSDLARLTELAVALVVVVCLLWVDAVDESVPVGFLVLGVAVWVGARCSVRANVWFAACTGTAVVVITLMGASSLSASSTEVASLLAQLFVVAVFGICLALATSRAEAARLQAALAAAAQEAAERAAFLDQTMAAVHEGILVIDAQRAVTFANPAAGRLLGVDPSADLAWLAPFTSFVVDGEQVPPSERPVARALRGEDVQDTEAWVGQDPPRVLSFGARRLSAAAGRDARVVLTARDVTVEHTQRAALETFAGVVAHDLQNPLSAIHGWTELLADHLLRTAPEDRRAGELIERMRTSSTRMRSLIDELLAYATVKDKQLSPEPVDLSEVVAQITRERGRTGQVVWGPLPTVEVDPTLVYQLFDNLVGNAVKFVAPGAEPEVVVRSTGEPGPDRRVVVEVSDNGTGIPAGQHEAIFSEFRRAHGRTHQGHGLGLAICRRIVERHGGTISAHDREDRDGATFRLTLPAAGATAGVA